ncbi:MAG: CdaR family protein [Kineothrix sp.]|jgi:YbbR domain-containing protein|nr:hypothetical protein C807_02338 [Lachnospiraceae bacterium 28-4]MCI8846104.1 hypothetical protein [Lachnospiraceae bacterium]MCX4344051.1 CdaR family protein [Kineothrix sp.]
MKKKLTDNLGLKIGSVLFAALLWLLVTNINNPATTRRVNNVRVTIINGEVLTSQGKIYEVLDDSDVLDYVAITGPKTVMNNIGGGDLVAIADMNKLTADNTIPIELSTVQYNESLDSIRASSGVVKLKVEDRKSISIPLRAETSGTLQEGYIVGDVTTDQNLVRVSGPESLISMIETAEVSVGIAGFTGDIGTNAEIKLYDANGTEVPKDKLTMNINTVGVNVEILGTKSVPLRFAASGTPANGYRATGVISSSPGTVLLAGKGSALRNLSVIEIPDTEVDITGATGNVTTTVDIRPYLSGSVELAEAGFDGNVAVTVNVEQEITRSITISESNIVIENLPEQYEGVISTYEEEFPIQVRGLAEEVNALDAEQIRGVVDINRLLETGVIEELGEGYYDVNLAFNLPDTVSLRENITVRLNIRERAATENDNGE